MCLSRNFNLLGSSVAYVVVALENCMKHNSKCGEINS